MLNVTDIATEENKEFEARLARFRSEQLILGQRLNQLDNTGKGLRDQKAAIEMQAAVVRDEFARKQALLERGLINRSDYTELLRIDAELLGQAAAVDHGVADCRSARTGRAFEDTTRGGGCHKNDRGQSLVA